MISLIEWLLLIPVSLISWPIVFLTHEYCHIKSQKLLQEGKIQIWKWSMSVSMSTYPRPKWFWFAGGILSGLIWLFLSLVAYYYGAWVLYVPWSTLAVVNLCYGIWEGTKGPPGRYKIYAISGVGMIIFWALMTWLYL